jgi:GDP-L-fucose synthase
MEDKFKIFLAGHNGMVGSAILRKLQLQGFDKIITAERTKLDLTDNKAVESFFELNKPETVIIAAAKVGGIQANIDNPVEFLLDNLTIQNNLIKNAVKYGAEKIVFLSSSCIYPRNCNQPMKESDILTGELEPTNEGYALAKIAGMKLLEAYSRTKNIECLTLIPCNLYGPNDSFDLSKSHVLSALIKRFTDARNTGVENITLWGTGQARREFMHVDDIANAVFYFLNNSTTSKTINIGPGTDISIQELAQLISKKVGFQGEIFWDSTKPDGMLKKCMDVSQMKSLGYKPLISLDEGIDQMIEIYKNLNN